MKNMEIDHVERALIFSQDLTGEGGKTWDLARNHIYGRYMVAVRDIEAGEAIFTEKPLVYGPSLYNNVLVCVACIRYMTRSESCSRCGWPVCSQRCPLIHRHTDSECQYLINYRSSLKTVMGEFDLSKIYFNCVIIIRIILLKRDNKDAWAMFNVLDPQLEDWKGREGWVEEERVNVNFIRDHLGLTICSEEEIFRIIAICATNTFSKDLEPSVEDEASRLVGYRWTKARVVYLLASMMAHSCLPNAEQSVSTQMDGLHFTLRATNPIKQGEQIQISYTDLLEPTMMRQYNLLKSKLFACSCQRCLDPRELGSNCGTMKCLTCLKNGTKPSGQLVSLTQDLTTWACKVCSIQAPCLKVQGLLFKINEELENLINNPDLSPQDWERFLGKYSKILEAGHGLLLKVKYQLCGLYGRATGYLLTDLDREKLERKRSLCEEVLQSLDILQPGLNGRRGLILYELHGALMMLGRSKLKADRPAAEADLRRALDCLKKSMQILSNESPGTFLYNLYQGGRESLSTIQQFVDAFGK